jgi:hypothetical protein
MKTVCVQFQPDRAPKASIQSISAIMLRIALAHKAVREFTIRRSRGRIRYVNFLFVGSDMGSVWGSIHALAFRHSRFGAVLRRACIATAEGSKGWSNYLLLHHFDPTQTLDRLAVPNPTLQPTSGASQFRGAKSDFRAARG